MKQVRNRYTGAAGITEREAGTIRGCIRKLRKLSNKKNLYVRHVYYLERSIEALEKVLREADR